MADGERGGLGTKVPISAVSSVTSTRDVTTLANPGGRRGSRGRAPGPAKAAGRQVLRELITARAGELRASGQAG
jgi:hypothetical protein